MYLSPEILKIKTGVSENAPVCVFIRITRAVYHYIR